MSGNYFFTILFLAPSLRRQNVCLSLCFERKHRVGYLNRIYEEEEKPCPVYCCLFIYLFFPDNAIFIKDEFKMTRNGLELIIKVTLKTLNLNLTRLESINVKHRLANRVFVSAPTPWDELRF